jgi:predicted nucleic acid-binding protein
MAVSPKRVYWDACAWIALIQDEQIPLASGGSEHRGALCRAVVVQGVKNKVEIFTSAFCLIEVCKTGEIRSGYDNEKLAAFFENDYIVVVNIDRHTGEHGRALMLAGYSKLKPADASHLAAALVCNVDEMHTFDDRLLALDGKLDKLDGTKLKICKPSEGGPALPLLEIAAFEKG